MKLSIAVIATGLALVGRATAIPSKVQNDDPNPPSKNGKCEPDGFCHLRDAWVHTGYRAEVKLWEQRSILVQCNNRCKKKNDDCRHIFANKNTECSIDTKKKKLPVMEPPVNIGPPNPLAKGAPKKPGKAAPKKARRNLRTEARDRRH